MSETTLPAEEYEDLEEAMRDVVDPELGIRTRSPRTAANSCVPSVSPSSQRFSRSPAEAAAGRRENRVPRR
jgi:hypothetical protein